MVGAPFTRFSPRASSAALMAIMPVSSPWAPALGVMAMAGMPVRSLSQRWRELHAKVAEYLNSGVQDVCVLDDDTRTIHLFHADRGSQVFAADDEFSVRDVLGDFCVKTRQFFD